ncbi:hypothetical protein OAE97_00355 [Verrucomicrobia bacterium]|nr:hypothetical protein [Verrucomicrobiota bacterium]
MSIRFIIVDCNLLITDVLIFKRFLDHTLGHTFSSSTPKNQKHWENGDFSIFCGKDFDLSEPPRRSGGGVGWLLPFSFQFFTRLAAVLTES